MRPENTLLAFDHGLLVGADGLEFDVQLSRDGVVVVYHDATLERTTNGIGSVAEYSADALGQLDAAFHFRGIGGERFMGRGHGIPRLGQVLARYPAVPLIIELKGRDPELGRRAAAEVLAAGALDRVWFGGFSRTALRAVREVAPDARISGAREEVRWFLYRSWFGLAPTRTSFQAFQVPEMAGRTRVVSPRFVEAARRAGLPVQVWTVDRPADMERLLGWGVEGLISDRPDLAAQVIRRWRIQHAARHGRVAATAPE